MDAKAQGEGPGAVSSPAWFRQPSTGRLLVWMQLLTFGWRCWPKPVTTFIPVVAFGKRLLGLTTPLSSETLGLICKRANLLSFFSTFLTYLSSDCSLLSLRLLSYTFLFFIYTSFPCAPVIFLSSRTGDGNAKEEIRIRRNSVPGKHDPAALSKACQDLSSVLETSSPALRNPWSLERAVLLLNLGIRQEKLAAQSRTASGLCQNASTKPPHSIYCVVAPLLSRLDFLPSTFTS